MVGPRVKSGGIFVLRLASVILGIQLNNDVFFMGLTALPSYSLCTSTMGGENRGGLPDLDRKSRSGFFFHPDLDFASRSGSPNLLEVGMEKSGFLTRLIPTILANFLEKSG